MFSINQNYLLIVFDEKNSLKACVKQKFSILFVLPMAIHVIRPHGPIAVAMSFQDLIVDICFKRTEITTKTVFFIT